MEDKMYQSETIEQYLKLEKGSMAFAAHTKGLKENEPIIVAMDAMIRYAKAYTKANDIPLSFDWVIGPNWLEIVKGIRGLCDGDGAVAMESEKPSRDSKDNGCIEGMFWDALNVAGYTEKDL